MASNPKTEVATMLESLYHLYVLEKVKRGLQRADSEGSVAHEDAKARLGKWLGS